MSKSFDAIVIGTGQSGPSLAAKLAKAGRQVAIIERDRFGGTCVNTGCTPTKTYVASARAAHVARNAADLGVVVKGDVTVDMQRVKARKDQICGASSSGVEKMLRTTEGCTVYQGHARFTSDNEVEVDGEVLTASQIFINVGARAVVPEIPGLSTITYLTNSSILEIDFVPRSLIVVGGSYIGLEFGQIFKRFGSQVTILERGPKLLGREDQDVSDAVRDIMANEGIDVHLNCKTLQFHKNGEEVKATIDGAVISGTHVLIASGRRPNTDNLGLENTTVQIDGKGFIQVDDQLRTKAGIWAIGDCNGRGAFTHTSYNDYEIVSDNLLEHGSRRVTDRIPAYNVYIDPPLGRAGMSETEVRHSGRKALVGKLEMSKVSRAREKGETQGFMKVLVDSESQQILGATVLGTGGDEVIHCILDVMYAKAPYTVLQRSVNIHPTVSELIPTMLGNLEPLEDGENH